MSGVDLSPIRSGFPNLHSIQVARPSQEQEFKACLIPKQHGPRHMAHALQPSKK